MLPRLVAHADWSVDARKRWMVVARLGTDGRYVADAPRLVGEPGALIDTLLADAGPKGRVFFGFDFPVGLPRAYAAKAGITDMVDALAGFGRGAWRDFYNVAAKPGEIGLHRPFYPARTPAGQHFSYGQLLAGLGLSSRDELMRHCDRGPPAAAPIFWTVGGNQVGKAALAGWRDLVAPALRDRRAEVGLWPFDGALDALLSDKRVVLAETYPGEIYSHLGLRFGRRAGTGNSGKRVQADRVANAAILLAWAKKAGVRISSGLRRQIMDGFGKAPAGEDPFDATVGVFGMLNIVLGRRQTGEPDAPSIRAVEGWILGRAAQRTLRAGRAVSTGAGFDLHPRLAADTVEVCRLDLCRVLLSRDSSFPWLVLVPQRAGVREIHELSSRDRARLSDEIDLASRVMAALFAPDKMNVAALGNMVSQLHIHVVARYRTDRAWPRPIWGSGPAEPYVAARLDAVRSRLRVAFEAARVAV
ncbi:MAG: HIT domain-containing protein [Alphaproteobacteria bacterium]